MNMSILGEMLTELKPGQEDPDDYQLLNDLTATCKYEVYHLFVPFSPSDSNNSIIQGNAITYCRSYRSCYR